MTKLLRYLLLFFILAQSVFCDSSGNPNRLYRSEVLYRKVYIGRTFTPSQTADIRTALKEWEAATNGAVSFEEVKTIDVHDNNIIIQDCSEDAPQIIALDEEVSNQKDKPMMAFGYFEIDKYIPTIYLVSSRMPDRTTYLAVIEHELGHALGLSHSTEENTVMFDDQSHAAKHLTSIDVADFCTIHYCDFVRTK